MGNTKYPLNGRYLTLSDLVYEYGFNTIDESIGVLKGDIIDKFDGIRNKLIDNYGYDASKDISIYIKINGSTFESSTYYTNFVKDIRGTDDKSIKPYEICYFPDVYSETERTEDNKSFKKLQDGDDYIYSPDTYIKHNYVETNTLRIPVLFHYVIPENYVMEENFNTNSKTYDTRFLFNYKLPNGEATASYALRKLYELDTDLKEFCKKPDPINDYIFNDSSGLLNHLNDISNHIVENNLVKPDAYKILCDYEKNICILPVNIDNISALLNVSDNKNLSTTALYYEYDSENNLQIEDPTHKDANLFYKVKYYSHLLVNSLRYKTGVIFNAKLDIINKNHIYKNSDILYRCDVGANTHIIDVSYNIDSSITVLYGLPARKLLPSDMINVDIPIITESAISKSYITYHVQYSMEDIEKLLILGSTVKANESMDKEYMQLYLKDNSGSLKQITAADNFKDICNSSLGTRKWQKEDEVKTLEEVLTDSSLHIYNPVTNAGYDTLSISDPNIFAGILRSNIKYDKFYFKCDIPIYRLPNYYYISQAIEKRQYLLYLIKPEASIFGEENINSDITLIYKEFPYIIYSNQNARLFMAENIDIYMLVFDTVQQETKYISGGYETDGTENIVTYNKKITYSFEDNKSVPASINAFGGYVYYNLGKESTSVTLDETDSFMVGINTISMLNSTILVSNYTEISISVLGFCKSNINGKDATSYLYTGYIKKEESTDSLGLIYNPDNADISYTFMLYSQKTEKIETLIKNNSDKIGTTNYSILFYSLNNISQISSKPVLSSFKLTNNNTQYKLCIYPIIIYCYILDNKDAENKVSFNTDKFTNVHEKLQNSTDVIYSTEPSWEKIFKTESGSINVELFDKTVNNLKETYNNGRIIKLEPS